MLELLLKKIKKSALSEIAWPVLIGFAQEVYQGLLICFSLRHLMVCELLLLQCVNYHLIWEQWTDKSLYLNGEERKLIRGVNSLNKWNSAGRLKCINRKNLTLFSLELLLEIKTWRRCLERIVHLNKNPVNVYSNWLFFNPRSLPVGSSDRAIRNIVGQFISVCNPRWKVHYMYLFSHTNIVLNIIKYFLYSNLYLCLLNHAIVRPWLKVSFSVLRTKWMCDSREHFMEVYLNKLNLSAFFTWDVCAIVLNMCVFTTYIVFAK